MQVLTNEQEFLVSAGHSEEGHDCHDHEHHHHGEQTPENSDFWAHYLELITNWHW